MTLNPVQHSNPSDTTNSAFRLLSSKDSLVKLRRLASLSKMIIQTSLESKDQIQAQLCISPKIHERLGEARKKAFEQGLVSCLENDREKALEAFDNYIAFSLKMHNLQEPNLDTILSDHQFTQKYGSSPKRLNFYNLYFMTLSEAYEKNCLYKHAISSLEKALKMNEKCKSEYKIIIELKQKISFLENKIIAQYLSPLH